MIFRGNNLRLGRVTGFCPIDDPQLIHQTPPLKEPSISFTPRTVKFISLTTCRPLTHILLTVAHKKRYHQTTEEYFN
ncbi:hypothetical protein ACRALDRAFT_207611 [Sodiomyces alcalophilus JCM 7366]|uniref:uncharacterized protein n=1 Tax=Sodiomyces alcalophilus JCM 7366 TaxID=591952 RepID=UPI0039B57635